MLPTFIILTVVSLLVLAFTALGVLEMTAKEKALHILRWFLGQREVVSKETQEYSISNAGWKIMGAGKILIGILALRSLALNFYHLFGGR